DLELSLLRRPLCEARAWLQETNLWWEAQEQDTRAFLSLTKALMVAADVAGSALPRRGLDIEAWVRAALRSVCSDTMFTEVLANRLKGAKPRPFQAQMANSPSRVTFVAAGCGTGKTAGAYAWARKWAQGRKLFFCYPTTGTASEGFAGYAVGVDGLEAALVHSRAAVDLDEILDNGRDEDYLAAHIARVFGLESWQAHVTVCTVDAVLGLMQNNRRGLFSSAAIVNGAFVFDEIHQYDAALFDMLVEFLTTLRGLPVLLMTASLPAHRLERLQAALQSLGEGLCIVQGPADLEAIPRYELTPASLETAIEEAKAVVNADGRVLWVCNTVDRCREVGRVLRGKPVLPYHARYRYLDRVARHRAVMDAFEVEPSQAAVAVTTQVCEVSLDISADLLVTDLAPIAALIQRLGRLNRRVTAEQPGMPKKSLIIQPPIAAPYGQDELDAASGWLEQLPQRALSQSDLVSGLVSAAASEVERQMVPSEWLSGGPYSAPGQLREPGFTLPVVRTEDLPDRADAKTVVENTIPMLLGSVADELFGWPRQNGAFVAPAGRITYSPLWGASWA
ncbi:MAG TPA: CRISPR-associated helicase Cas3', partial [Chloroflexota bacterium]|nr:CRISPR-associated helicase Cas3' [Chloroflexota bacterium]